MAKSMGQNLNWMNTYKYADWLARLKVLTSIFTLTGSAAVGPDYTQPETRVSDAWHTPMNGGLDATAPNPKALSQWWKILDDPVLCGLVNQTTMGNLDLKEANAG